MRNKILLIISIVMIAGCNSEYVSRPRGFFKIDLPPKKYQLFNESGFPYSFEYPVYSNIVRDSLFFDEKAENNFWINLDFPQFNGKVHISYKEIGKHKFDSLVNDAFTMSYKQHTYKASGIEPKEFSTAHGIGGVNFTLKGNAATTNQFFATDSIKHFLRGALYFSATPNADSIKPVNQFLKADVEHLINTLRWK